MSNEEDKNPRSGGGEGTRPRNQTTGIEELRGYYYVYGVPRQAENYLRTTRKIADHVGTTMGKDMWYLVHELEEVEFPNPPEPEEIDGKPKSMIEVEKFRMLFKMKEEKEENYKKEKGKVFRIIVGQCTNVMRNKIEGLSEFKKMEMSDDVIGLLKKLKGFAYSTQGVQYEYWTMQAALRNWINLAQEPKESIEKYGQRFVEQTNVTEEVWGALIPMTMKGKKTEEQVEAGNKFKACVFLAGVDRQRFRTVIDDLNNNFVQGNVSYPVDVPGMVRLLTNRRGHATSRREEDDLKDGLSFSQTSGGKSKKVRCFKCKKKGHIARDCTEEGNKNMEKETSEQASGFNGFSIVQRSINDGWMSG
jgi:hypothetical protein